MRWFTKKFINALSLLAGSTLLIFSYQNCARDFDATSYSSSSTEGPDLSQGGVNTLLEKSLTDISEILKNRNAVKAIISDTSSNPFNCLVSSSSSCLVGSPRTTLVNRVFNANGIVHLNTLVDPHIGLNLVGAQCSTFNFLNQTNGLDDENCPLKVEILWEPTCADDTYSCSNSQLVHNFRVRHLTSNSSENLIVLSEKLINVDSSFFTFDNFTDQRGSGITLYSYDSSTQVRSPSRVYRSCSGELVFSPSTSSCSCPIDKTEDLDVASKCVPATQDCRSLYANSAICIKRYDAVSNNYILNTTNPSDFQCTTGYAISNGQCNRLPLTYHDISGENGVGLYQPLPACTKTFTGSDDYTYNISNIPGCPQVNSSCSSLNEVVCCNMSLYILDGPAEFPVAKYKCQ